MNLFGEALADYQAGSRDAAFDLVRDDSFRETVPVKIFFAADAFPPLELCALDRCEGSVLDVGAGAGRHSLELHRRGLEVWSLELLPPAFAVLQRQGVPHPVLGDLLLWSERSFDTVLMLMNGLGLVGTPEGLDRFLNHAHRLVAEGGRILCDSIDVSSSAKPEHIAYRNRNLQRGFYPGQQQLKIEYAGKVGNLFPWLHLDFETLDFHARHAGWRAEKIRQEPDGHYLAQITRPPS
jgi:SAM-dependent methyltransferase